MGQAARERRDRLRARRPFASLPVIAVVLLGACRGLAGLDADFQLADERSIAEGGGPTTSPEGAVDTGPSSIDDAGPADPADSGACDGGPCRSCRDRMIVGGATSSGVYRIEGASGEQLSVFCEMTLAGGGWTLVGRSVSGGVAAGFGWRSSHGSALDDQVPYSLDVRRLAVAPAEILFGERGQGKAWGSRVYRARLPVGFPSAVESAAGELLDRITVSGTCGGGGGAMQRYVGFASRTDLFFFRDVPANDQLVGLRPDRWDAINPSGSCTYNGELHGTQGMVFVR